ncbi:MAG TPA: ArsA-related P-loop ATPase [Bryobacteraceae bacterium]|nr:ArsA-related P-loop ATPase [Bryobacteraceae bacterium]HXJ42920.1 ArsA-related P-loop ATPase [Bryobacteraceae bacterium]
MSSHRDQSKLIVFCGKGGVGKTTISLAFALSQADRGRKVVVVTSHPLKELALSISLDGLKEQHHRAAANLFVTYLSPQEILKQRVLETIPSAMLGRAVTSSRIYKSLIEVAPGLKEIAFLGRLTQMARERSQGEDAPRFDLLVWDAPATGHFLQTLKVSRNFHAYLPGPLSALGADLADFFSDSSRLALFAITILEEMAVEETHDLYRSLIQEVEVQPSGLICNMVSPWISAHRLAADGTEPGQPSESLRLLWDRFRVERLFVERLATLASGELRMVERVPESEATVSFLFEISRQLASLGGLDS